MATTGADAFSKLAIAAFPQSCRKLGSDAALSLIPFVDGSYRNSATHKAIVLGQPVRIPTRICFLGLHEERPEPQINSDPAVQCLCTRSTNGYVRQAALRRLINRNEPWIIPFVVLLAGEYVVEIVDDIVAELPMLNRDAYINFVRENRSLMRLVRSKATSYWDCYYRSAYPDRRSYPGLVFINELDVWAS